MSVEPPPSENTTLHHSFSCGAEGEHQGAIVGCCHVCGQLLCEAHIYYIPYSPRFGDAAADNIPLPLACKSHAGENRRRGLPGERQLPPSKTNTAPQGSQKKRARPKPKRPKPTGRRI